MLRTLVRAGAGARPARGVRGRARRRARAGALAPLLAAGLLLGACSDAGTPAPEESPASEPGPDEPTDEPAEEPTDDGASSGGAACVEGTWVGDNAAQAASTTSGLGMADLGAEATVTGESVTTIEGSTMTTEYRDMVVEVAWELEGQSFRLVNTWSGTLTGTVEVTDEQVVVSDVDPSALDMRYETFVNGSPLAVPGLEEIPLSGMAAGGTSTYTCDGDELRLTPVVEGVDTSGFVTVLRRR